MPVPPRAAQARIAIILQKITALRAHHTAITADCDALLPALLNDIFG